MTRSLIGNLLFRTCKLVLTHRSGEIGVDGNRPVSSELTLYPKLGASGQLDQKLQPGRKLERRQYTAPLCMTTHTVLDKKSFDSRHCVSGFCKESRSHSETAQVGTLGCTTIYSRVRSTTKVCGSKQTSEIHAFGRICPEVEVGVIEL